MKLFLCNPLKKDANGNPLTDTDGKLTHEKKRSFGSPSLFYNSAVQDINDDIPDFVEKFKSEWPPGYDDVTKLICDIGRLPPKSDTIVTFISNIATEEPDKDVLKTFLLELPKVPPPREKLRKSVVQLRKWRQTRNKSHEWIEKPFATFTLEDDFRSFDYGDNDDHSPFDPYTNVIDSGSSIPVVTTRVIANPLYDENT